MDEFVNIYQKYYPLIFRIVAAIVQNREDVPDIVQNVFVKLYLQMTQGVVVEFPKTWLSKVAANESRNFIIRKRNHDSLDTVWSIECSETDLIENQLMQAESRNNLQKALEQLSEKEKMLLTLYSESFSYKEIAEIANIQPASVGKAISRALDRLKNVLKIKNNEMFD